jgi:RNA polymerase sigma-70 factor (ECF subfamily)
VEDAEDALQETFLRAWRHLDSVKNPSALRAWLYKIATRVSLDFLDDRKARFLPDAITRASDPQASSPGSPEEPSWLEPLPDEYLDNLTPDPEARYEIHESVSLAFLAVLQKLPGRQRSILILRDVLGWPTREVAELLDLSTAAVNSALQRARATIEKQRQNHEYLANTKLDNLRVEPLLARYIQAWEAMDTEGLTKLLSEDAVMTMPPLTARFLGPPAIGKFFGENIFQGPPEDRYRLVAVKANGSPAFAVYQVDLEGVFRLSSLQVLDIRQGQIIRIDSFLAQNRQFSPHFGLPLSL